MSKRGVVSFVVLVCLLLHSGGVTTAAGGKKAARTGKGPTRADKPVTRGTYVDNNGAKHQWYINQGHTLIWDGEPYFPMGGRFDPPYRYQQDKEWGWKLTKAQFELMGKKGVKDVMFYSVSTPKMLNRAMRYLDAHGFRYGMEWGHGLNWGPQVYDLVKGGHTVEPITKSGTYRFAHASSTGGFYVVLDKDTGKVVGHGTARTYEHKKGDKVEKGLEADVDCPPGRKLSLHFVSQSTEKKGPTTVWDAKGMEAVRARYQGSWGELKLGSGLRFIVDPARGEMRIWHGTVPAHPGYHREVAEWLKVRYKTVAALNAAWATLPDSRLESFLAAARLVPVRVITAPVAHTDYFTRGGLAGWERGILYDPIKEKVYLVDIERSQMWYDTMECHGKLWARKLAEVTRIFKEEYADVPFVMKQMGSFGMHRVSPAEAGVDGIGMDSYGVGQTMMQMNSSVAYAEVEQAERTMWLIGTEVAEAAFRPQLENVAYMDRESMYADFSTLLSAGAKGIIHFGISYGSYIAGDHMWLLAEMMRDPRQFEWMGVYRRAMYASETLVDYRPEFYYWFPVQRRDKTLFGPTRPDYVSINGNWPIEPRSRPPMPTRDGTWILPTFTAHIDTSLVISNLQDTPASTRWGPDLEALIKKGFPRVAYVGFRHDLTRIPTLDKYFTGDFAYAPDGRKFQILRPTRSSRVLGKTPDGHVWNLIDGSLQIISKEVLDALGWYPHGLITPASNTPRNQPDFFMENTLGLRMFSFGEGIRGFSFVEAGTPLTYLWATTDGTRLRLTTEEMPSVPPRYANGALAEQTAVAGGVEMVLPVAQQPKHEIAPQPVAFIEIGRRVTENWREALVLTGVTPEDLKKSLGKPGPLRAVPEVAPHIWIGADPASESNFNLGRIGGMTRLYSGAFWGLDTKVTPPGSGYFATYTFNAKKGGSHDLFVREWINKSGCRWRINGGAWSNMSNGDMRDDKKKMDVQFCGPWSPLGGGNEKIKFGWYRYGQAALKKGKNTVEIEVTKAHARNGRYMKFLDALVLTKDDAGFPKSLKPVFDNNYSDIGSQLKLVTSKIGPADAKTFDGHWYKLIEEGLSWHEARKRCEAMGGYLVCVESKEEAEFIRWMVGGKSIWLGATDEVKEGEWKWVNGKPFTYKNWRDDQPENHVGVEHYLQLFDQVNGAQWNDAPEHLKYFFICEWER